MPEIIVKLGDNVVHKYFFTTGAVRIGRASDNDIAIENLAVSRHHATITCESGRFLIEDAGSSNGTYINGVKVQKSEIMDKDVVTIGKHKLHFYNQQLAAVGAQFAEKTMLFDSAPVEPAAPTLRVIRGKQEGEIYEISKPETTIGKAADNDIQINDWFVSKHHAVIVCKGGRCEVRDLDSWRHTLVNGAIVQERILANNDEIQFGPKVAMVFDAPVEAGDEQDPRRPVELEGDVPRASAGDNDEAPISSIRIAPPEAESGEASEAEEAHEAAAPGAEQEILVDADSSEEIVLDSVDSILDQVGSGGAEDGGDEEIYAQDGTGKEADESVASDLHAEEFRDRIEGDFGVWVGDDSSAESESSDKAEEAESESTADAVGCGEEQAATGDVSDMDHQGEDAPEEVAVMADGGQSVDDEQVQVWLRALDNPSPIIRKQARRKLKALTGRDYDDQS